MLYFSLLERGPPIGSHGIRDKAFLSHGMRDSQKNSCDTGFEKLKGFGIMPEIDMGYGKEPFFLMGYGIDLCSGTKYFNLH